MIFLIAFNPKPIEFRVQAADALEDADVARLAERFANHFRLHSHKLLHYRIEVKPIQGTAPVNKDRFLSPPAPRTTHARVSSPGRPKPH
jgi:hypothetical protein